MHSGSDFKSDHVKTFKLSYNLFIESIDFFNYIVPALTIHWSCTEIGNNICSKNLHAELNEVNPVIVIVYVKAVVVELKTGFMFVNLFFNFYVHINVI